MFTGIITAVGCLKAVRGDSRRGLSLDIQCNLPRKDLAQGASVACNGVCLTVIKAEETVSDGYVFTAEVSPETLSVTDIGSWRNGHKINLEGSLRVGDALGGHWVTGHVDGLGHIQQVVTAGDGHQRWFIACPEELMGYIAPRGSVAVDGCSLTVVEVRTGYFALNMIPHTLGQTRFDECSVNDAVHIEVDILARYVARWKEAKYD